jgi:hypothetical protein
MPIGFRDFPILPENGEVDIPILARKVRCIASATSYGLVAR